MAVKIRLARAGAKKAPFYRIVAADSRAPRDGRFIEILGRYNPRTDPSTIELDVEKTDAWLAKGAQPTEVVVKLIAIAKGEKTLPVADDKLSKKAKAKAAKAAEATEEAAIPQAEVPAEEVVAEAEEPAEAAAPEAEEPAEDAAPETE